MADSQIRQEFIAQVLKRFPLPSNVERVTYGTIEDVLRADPNYEENPPDAMVFVGLIIEGQRDVFEIFVLPQAFSGENIKNEEDFIGALLHEYSHSQLFEKEGFTTLVRGFVALSEFQFIGFYKPIMELYALERELQRITEDNSLEYREAVEGRYIENYLELWKLGKIPKESLKSDLKVEFFPLEIYPLTVEQILYPLGITRFDGTYFGLTPQEVEKLKRRILQKVAGS